MTAEASRALSEAADELSAITHGSTAAAVVEWLRARARAAASDGRATGQDREAPRANDFGGL